MIWVESLEASLSPRWDAMQHLIVEPELCPVCRAERAESALAVAGAEIAAFRGIKAFQLNDCDVVAAHSVEEAVAWYKREFGEDAADLCEDDILEVDLSTMHFREGGNRQAGRCTMRESMYEQIGHLVANGLRFEPWVLSSTEF